MRIIGGQFKGRSLETLKGADIRPTTDRVKESIFNLIQNEVEEAEVLDLFAGSGALGIEAVSRGAARVTFADASRDAVEVLKRNLEKVKGQFDICTKDYRAALGDFTRRGKKFSLIFLDPPYDKGMEDTALKLIDEGDLLEEGGIVVLERKRDSAVKYALPSGLAEKDARDYGATSIHILARARKAALTGTFDPFTAGHLFLAETALQDFDILHVAVLQNPDKNMRFSLDKRIKWIEKSLKPYKKRVRIHQDDGLAIDYCRRYGIQYIIRGFRNETDFAYETEMAAVNKKTGGVETLLIPAQNETVSSTLVKARLEAGEDITGLVPKAIQKELTAEGKRWKT